MKNVIVYYQKKFSPYAKYSNDFSKTHTKVFEGAIKDNENQEHVFSAFNDNYLNPLSMYNTTNKVCLLDSGEAVTGEKFQEAMKTKKVSCGHTSMSVGDIVSVDGTNYLCQDIGWKKLNKEEKQLNKEFIKNWEDMTGWLCDNCLSSNIYKLPVMDEMDIFCRDCNSKNYQVSEWYINRNKKETI